MSNEPATPAPDPGPGRVSAKGTAPAAPPATPPAPGGQAVTPTPSPSTPPTPGTPPEPAQATPAPGDKAPAASDGEPNEDHFTDPRNLPPELLPAFKKMQGAYTRKAQELAADRKKVDAYNAFVADPHGQVRAMAQRLGIPLAEAAARAGAEPPGPSQDGIPADWQPQGWGDVYQKFEQGLSAKLEQMVSDRLGEITPVIKKLNGREIERTFDGIDKDWRNYEGVMQGLLRDHPTLVNDPEKLYRLSVPAEVQKTEALQAAMAELTKRTEAAKPGGKSAVPHATAAKPKVNSFQDAVNAARAQLNSPARY